jgi:crotonobetainyl-CoA:carnitine CoA-transferase CaiB-like acyl-CoA transferase
MIGSFDGGALAGLRVVDITQVMAGAYCGMLLADLGADVIKVERPGIGDLTRWAGDGVDAFEPLNRNKRGIAVDFTTPDGAAVVRRLAASADVIVENHRPGALAKYGIGPDDLTALDPRLVYCSISGFGTTGPLSPLGGFDLMAQGLSGVMSLTGEPGRPPCKVGVPIADLNAAMFATVGVLAALVRRGIDGRGQVVTTSLLESTIAYTLWESMMLFQAGVVGEPGGSAHRLAAPYEAFPTADGWITIAAPQPDLYRALCEAIDRPELIDDERFATPANRLAHRDALADELARSLRTRSTVDWCAALAEAGVPSGPVHRIDQAFDDPQVLAAGMVEVDDAGRRRLGHGVKLQRTPMTVKRGAPALGEHSREVLREVGYDDAAIDDLGARRVVQLPRAPR